MPPKAVLCSREGSPVALLAKAWRIARKCAIKLAKLGLVTRPGALRASVGLVFSIDAVVRGVRLVGLDIKEGRRRGRSCSAVATDRSTCRVAGRVDVRNYGA